jgi:hypothetical protein
MKHQLILLLTLFVTSCTSLTHPEEKPAETGYPSLGVAPELVGDVWINAETPIRLADLRGKVVLVDMWTFG